MSQSVKLGMNREVSSLLRRMVRLCLTAISMSSGKGSRPRVITRAGMSWARKASKHLRRSSELICIR